MNSHEASSKVPPVMESYHERTFMVRKNGIVRMFCENFFHHSSFCAIVYDGQISTFSHAGHVGLGPKETAGVKLVAATSSVIQNVSCEINRC